LKRERFAYLVHNYFPAPAEPFFLNLASADAAIRERSLRFVDRALELTAELGAPFYSVHAGFAADPVDFDGRSLVIPDGGDLEQAQARFVDALRPALAKADELGLDLLVENNVTMPHHRGKLLLAEPAGFERLFAELPHPRLAILLDTGHLNVSAHTLGFDRADALVRLAPHVRAVHLHDNDGSADTHSPVEPGSWALAALRPGVTPIVEARFPNTNALAAHLSWLASR
jgi:sugar phosphate isomerase/epimerase